MKRWLSGVLCLFSGAALAGQCEDNFGKDGNAFKGTRYFSQVRVPALSPQHALGQMRGILIAPTRRFARHADTIGDRHRLADQQVYGQKAQRFQAAGLGGLGIPIPRGLMIALIFGASTERDLRRCASHAHVDTTRSKAACNLPSAMPPLKRL